MNASLSRRSFLSAGTAAALVGGTAISSTRRGRAQSPAAPVPDAKDTFALLRQGKKIPVILDTDIGGDIDDTWALVMLLRSPELDVKLVTSDSGNDVYRARIIAKMLEVCGRTDVPVGIGLGKEDRKGRQSAWVGDYDLADYPGTVHDDGLDALIKTIRASDDPMTLVAIGPVPNIAAALERDPGIARKARFVGMHGSVRRGYGNSPEISAEYNVRADPKALQKVFAAPWDVTITPLDTCGIVHLTGEKFRKVYTCEDPCVRALMHNYRVWLDARNAQRQSAPPNRSSTLFDTVAIYLAFSQDLLEMEDLGIRVTDEGMTVIDPDARTAHCAMRWKDLGAFEDLLVERLTSAG